MPEELLGGLILVYGPGEEEEARENGYWPGIDEYRATFFTEEQAIEYAKTIPVPTTIVYDGYGTWEVYVDYAEGEE